LVSGGHTYDYLLCYGCHGLALYKDGKYIANFAASGSADILNGLLTANHVPLAYIYSPKFLAEEKKRLQEEEAAEARWKAAMPSSFLPLWKEWNQHEGADIKRFQAALVQQFPNKDHQILALLKLYGSGDGTWMGPSAYESLAAELLLSYTTLDIIAVFKRNMLSREQLEGAARLFSMDIPTSRPRHLELLSPELKQLLLTHALKSKGFGNADSAKRAFAN
jgi:hypothetical protein